MTSHKKFNFTQVDPQLQLSEIQKNILSLSEQIQIEEDFLHQGLEYWLNNFREENSITQNDLAKALGVTQPAICQMLKKPSRLATLSRLVTAMGGTLDITITHKGKTSSLLFGTTNEQIVLNDKSQDSELT